MLDAAELTLIYRPDEASSLGFNPSSFSTLNVSFVNQYLHNIVLWCADTGRVLSECVYETISARLAGPLLAELPV